MLQIKSIKKLLKRVLSLYRYKLHLSIILLFGLFLILSNELFSFSEEIFLLFTFIIFFMSVYTLIKKIMYSFLKAEIDFLYTTLTLRGFERVEFIRELILAFEQLINAVGNIYELLSYSLYLNLYNFATSSLQSCIGLDISMFFSIEKNMLMRHSYSCLNLYPSRLYINAKALMLSNIHVLNLNIFNDLANLSKLQISGFHCGSALFLQVLKKRSILHCLLASVTRPIKSKTTRLKASKNKRR